MAITKSAVKITVNPSKQSCETCVFVCKKGIYDWECRYMPPSMVKDPRYPHISESCFPSVGSEIWCGRWRKNPNNENFT